MSTFSVGGLASGLDTKSIIEQLLSIDARPKVRQEWNKALWTARKDIWTEVNKKLLNLQNAATAINSPTTWNAAAGITSSDPAALTGTSFGPSPAAGTYTVNVSQVAANERWSAANQLSAAVGGTRQSGTWYDGTFSPAAGSTLLTNLTDFDGTPLGLDAGSTITMNANVGGSPVSASFVVGAGSTLDDLAQWAESNAPGSAFTVNGDGTITYQSGAGAANEIQSLSMTATNSSSAALPIFNGTDGATSTFVAGPSGGAAAADTLTITQGASTWNVAIAAGSDEAAIAAAINGTAGIGISASVVGGRLQLDSSLDGAAGAFNVSSSGSLAGDLGLAQSVAAQDAMFDVDGTAYTRSTNSVTDVITDVQVDLLAATASPVTLTVGTGNGDTDAIKTKIKSFVEAYNSVVQYVNAKTSEQKVYSAKNLGDFLKGPMARDFGLSSIAFDLRRWTTDIVNGLPGDGNALDDIGITTGALAGTYSPQNVSGELVIDEAKLDAALAADPAKVQDMLTHVGGGARTDDGITRRISALVSEWRVGGKVDYALQGANRQIKDLQDRMDRMDDRLEMRRAYYERMFSSLETTLGRMQSQGSWLSGQLASLMGSQQ